MTAYLKNRPEYEALSNWSQEPFLHIFPIYCADKKAYDTSVRDELKNWVGQRSETDDWMVVYLLRQNDPARKTPFFNVHNYMKKDFNPKNEERIFQVKLYDDGRNDEQVIEQICQRLAEIIQRRSMIIMEKTIAEIRKLDAERQHPGWNFCKFFAVKESLAFIYETFGMLEEALLQYDELEALFSTIFGDPNLGEAEVISGNLSGVFPLEFGGRERGDDIGAVLNYALKPFQLQIYNSTITIFDFRHYMFARQCRLLLMTRQPLSLAERGVRFIDGMGIALRLKKFSLSFRLVWKFGAYLELAEECNNYVNHLMSLTADTAAKEGSKEYRRQRKQHRAMSFIIGDMFASCANVHTMHCDISNLQLEELGKLRGLLPSGQQFVFGPNSHQAFEVILREWESSIVDSTHRASEETVQFEISSPPLRLALGLDDSPGNAESGLPPEPYDMLYITLMKKAIRSFRECRRHRGVSACQFNLANLHFTRGRYEEASVLLRKVISSQWNNPDDSLFGHSSPGSVGDAFSALLHSIHCRLAECYRQIGLHQDYLGSLLHLLLHHRNADLALTQYVYSQFLQTCALDGPLEKKLAVANLPALVQLTFSPHPNTGNHYYIHLDEQLSISFTISQTIPLTSVLVIDSITAQFVNIADMDAGVENPRLLLVKSGRVVLPVNGDSPITGTIIAEAEATGEYVCEKCWISVGQLLLTQYLLSLPPSQILRLSVSPSVPTVQLEVLAPPTLVLGDTVTIAVLLKTCEDTVREATLSLYWESPISPQHSLILNAPRSESSFQLTTTHLKSNEDMASSTLLARPVVQPQSGVQVEIPTCEPGEQMLIKVPLLARHAVKKSSELHVELHYRKENSEFFILKSAMDLTFQQPFIFRQALLPLEAKSNQRENSQQVFARCEAENIANAPVVILSYEMRLNDLSSTHIIANDPNSTVPNTVLNPGESLCLLFELNYVTSTSEVIENLPQIVLTYKFHSPSIRDQISPRLNLGPAQSTRTARTFRQLIQQPDDTFQFTQRVRLVLPSFDYRITVNAPLTAAKGARVLLKWTIRARSEVETSDIMYSIFAQESTWVIASKKRAFLTFTSRSLDTTESFDDVEKDFSQVSTVECTLVPIIAGLLPLPRLHLDGVPAVKVENAYSLEQGVRVYPPHKLTSTCEKITISEKKRQSLFSLKTTSQ